MLDLGFPLPIRRFIASFLTGRKIRLYFDGLLLNSISITGSPQGSPLSPILSQIFLRDLIFQVLLPRGATIEQALQISYIDDFSISVASNSVLNNTRALEAISEDLFSKATEKGMPFNGSKSELIHFTTQAKASKPKVEEVLPGSQRIKPLKVVRYLGVWFDIKLTFRTYVEKRLNLAVAVL